MTNEVLDYCANESCNAEIHFGQEASRKGGNH